MSSEGRSAATSGRPTPRRPRDMIISLAVLLVPIGLIFVGWNFLMGGQAVNPVDFDESVAEAKRAGLTVLEPDGLGDAWVPISHSVDNGKGEVTLRIGYHTPNEAGLQLVESDAKPSTLLDSSLGEGAEHTGDTKLGGREWDVYRVSDGDKAYVSTVEETTVVVVADASVSRLDEFAAALN